MEQDVGLQATRDEPESNGGRGSVPEGAVEVADQEGLVVSPDISFFQLVEELQRLRPDAPPVGATHAVAEEIVRFRANPTFAFPPSEVSSISSRPDRPDLYEVMMNVIGLYGPASPLPTIFTERVLDTEAGGAVAAFLDLFNHRFASLLVLVWRHYRHDLRYKSGAADSLSLAIGALFGLLPVPGERREAMRPVLLPYAGLLSMGSRSASITSGILAHLLDLPCCIEEFVARDIRLPAEARFVLGRPRELGVETVIGETMPDVTGHCRIWVGPMRFERFEAFLPDGAEHRRLTEAIDFVIQEPLARDLGLVLFAGEAPEWRLGHGKLGWTSWAVPDRKDEVRVVV